MVISWTDGRIEELKTSKVALLQRLEQGVPHVSERIEQAVSVVDAMALVQKANATGFTFGLLALKLLVTVLNMSQGGERVDVVFDFHHGMSIENIECHRWGLEDLVIKTIVVTQPIHQ